MKKYTFDFSAGFTIADYAVFQRSQHTNEGGKSNSPEQMQEFYEAVDKFYEGDLFTLDMNEVTEVIKQFAEALGKHMRIK